MSIFNYMWLLLLNIVLFVACDRVKNPASDDAFNIHGYDLKLVARYTHDTGSQTEGLVYKDGYLYESTGPSKNSPSSLRKVEIQTGNVLMRINLENTLFGEGATILNEKIVQLTYRAGIGFVYDLDHFTVLDTFAFPPEGWGLTHDGKNLIVSNGTSVLSVLDTSSFKVVERICVTDSEGAVDKLNELDYIDGVLFANIHGTGQIVCIRKTTGRVIYNINLWDVLKGQFDNNLYINLANGIAFDVQNQRLYLTGKFWPYLFEFDFSPIYKE